MAESLQSRRIKQGNVTAVLYEVCRSVVINNITDHYEEEYLSMYFETSEKSGGGRVENVHMLGEGEVIIVFEDPKGTAVFGQPHIIPLLNIHHQQWIL